MLFSLFPGIVVDRLSLEWLVIKAIPHDELLDYFFKELFKASSYAKLLKPSSLFSAELLQLPLGTINTRLAGVAVNPLLNLILTNQLLFYGQDAIKSLQGTLEYRASEDLQLPLLTTGINNRTPRHITSDLGKDKPLLPQSVIWAE